MSTVAKKVIQCEVHVSEHTEKQATARLLIARLSLGGQESWWAPETDS